MRIILHGGTPKTGTTALQSFLHSNREALLRRGVLYPLAGISPPPEPKHHWMIGALLNNNPSGFTVNLEAALGEARADTHTMILSAEGLFHRWWDFSDPGRALLQQLACSFDVAVWVVFREPIAFLRSFYIQMLKNPAEMGPFYGRDMSVSTMLSLPRFAIHFDYAGYIGEVEALLGPNTVRPFSYRSDTVADILAALDVDDLRSSPDRSNRSLGAPGVALLRQTNRYETSAETKRRVVDLVAQIDGLLHGEDDPLPLDPEVIRRVTDLAAPSLVFLAERYALHLDGAPACHTTVA